MYERFPEPGTRLQLSLKETIDPIGDQPPSQAVFVSYAQNYEDVLLWRAFKTVERGSYVDVGAADPVDDSVTAAFYERGWRGVNVEPVPAFAAALRAARPGDLVVEQGVASVPGTAVFHVVEGTGWSTFDPTMPTVAADHGYGSTEIEVTLSTLDVVLGDAGYDGRPIHFLKIDVEGFEAEVLRGTDLRRWKPWVVVVEATAPGTTTQTHDEWEHLVVDAGYKFCLFDGLNRYYVHSEHTDLVPMLSYPVSIFDEPFKRRRELDTEARLELSVRECDRHAVEVKRLIGEVHRFATEVDRLVGEVRQLRMGADELRVERRELMRDNVRWRNEALIERASASEQALVRGRAEHEFRAAAQQAANLQTELDAVHATLSWRITKPLRSVRRIRRRTSGPAASASRQLEHLGESLVPAVVATDHGGAYARAFLARAQQVAQLLNSSEELDGVESPLEALERGLVESAESDLTKAWLGLVVATACYPDEDAVRAEGRRFRRVGAAEFVAHLVWMFESSVHEGRARDVELDVVAQAVVIDVTHTAQHDLQTGIQRVVRETCSRWLDGRLAAAVWWDYSTNVLRRLDQAEVDRFREWRKHMPETHGTEMTIRALDHTPSAVVVPWKSILLLPELTAEPARTGGYRALSCAGVVDGISMIGYDIIPVTAAETVTAGMSQVFSLYLSMVKRSTRLAAISEAAANDFRAFNGALPSQGLTGPLVRAYLLPPSPATLTDRDIERVRDSLSLGALPMVLVVGSHEPRKNHLTVLDAAERLWSSDVWFDLVFIGGSGWGADHFDREVERLTSIGRPVKVLRRATEVELWAAYRLARFSVFPSLLEGYGLPIVESIASGTPVITTNYGSMSEVAVEGGALLVDPYDAGELEQAMRSLLDDHQLLARLRREAEGRTFNDWDRYASDVWNFLVEDAWSDGSQ